MPSPCFKHIPVFGSRVADAASAWKRLPHGPAVLILFLLGILTLPAGAGAQQQAAGQPLPTMFVTSDNCLACHNDLIAPSGQDVSIGSNWQSSLMAHSAKDPYWQASVRREVKAHPSAAESIQDECSACHMPMSRYRAKVQNQKGRVFAHLPILPARTPAGRLAADGVSCSMCHQIQPDGLGSQASFTAGFVVDTATPLGQREIFGPFEVDQGRTRIMQSAAQMVPDKGLHVQDSELCASCHTLYTHTRGPDGQVIGELPEQVPYLEWKHSDYAGRESCQSCHMPQLEQRMHISAVLGQPRESFSRHVFRGGNFFMPKLFNRHRAELGVTALSQELNQAARETEKHLQTSSARLNIEIVPSPAGKLLADVQVVNLAGHKLPTAYPSRRAWIRFSVRDAADRVVFESGRIDPDGSIQGNANDVDPDRYEAHFRVIDSQEQVQVYEAIMADPKGKVTTGLIEAIRFIKDNRLLPEGFDKASASEDIAVQGRAASDSDFTGSGDRVRYRVQVDPDQGPFTVEAELVYQPIAYRWAQNLKEQQAEEIDRFVTYYNDMSRESWTVLASDRKRVHE
jgi:hypothetical protein